MTGKDVETVATLLKRVRERAEQAKQAAATRTTGLSGIRDVCPADIVHLAEGQKSLAAAIEMLTIELASLRSRLDAQDRSIRHLALRTSGLP